MSVPSRSVTPLVFSLSLFSLSKDFHVSHSRPHTFASSKRRERLTIIIGKYFLLWTFSRCSRCNDFKRLNLSSTLMWDVVALLKKVLHFLRVKICESADDGFLSQKLCINISSSVFSQGVHDTKEAASSSATLFSKMINVARNLFDSQSHENDAS